jgi:hypothetical protein
MKKIKIEYANGEKFFEKFTDYEIQMGIDEYDELFELIYSSLYF